MHKNFSLKKIYHLKKILTSYVNFFTMGLSCWMYGYYTSWLYNLAVDFFQLATVSDVKRSNDPRVDVGHVEIIVEISEAVRSKVQIELAIKDCATRTVHEGRFDVVQVGVNPVETLRSIVNSEGIWPDDVFGVEDHSRFSVHRGTLDTRRGAPVSPIHVALRRERGGGGEKGEGRGREGEGKEGRGREGRRREGERGRGERGGERERGERGREGGEREGREGGGREGRGREGREKERGEIEEGERGGKRM